MAILLAMAIAFFSQEAQAALPPVLHQRPILASSPVDALPIYPEDGSRIAANWQRGAIDFPPEAAGFYRFRDDAQGVRIVSHNGEISGYLLKLGKGTVDKDMILGYDFNDVAGTRNQLHFTTRQVHGIWYGFEGKVIQRGSLNRDNPASYILQGTLTEHDESQQTTQSAAIRLRFEGPR
jgi:hypothetical protein